jgi:hypothetical protein
VAEPPAPAEPEAGQQAGSGFSFDEFFEGDKPAPPPDQAGEAPESGGGEDEDDDFRSWLQGLKT